VLTSIERLQALQTDCTLSVQRSGVYEGLDGAVMGFKRGETDVYQQLNRINLKVTDADCYGVAIEIPKRRRCLKIIIDRIVRKTAGLCCGAVSRMSRQLERVVHKELYVSQVG
jgi:hypothetical protein